MQEMDEKEKEILMRTSNTDYYAFENELLQMELKEMAFEQFKQTKRHVCQILFVNYLSIIVISFFICIHIRMFVYLFVYVCLFIVG